MAISVVAGSAVGASSSTSITKPTTAGYTETSGDLILIQCESSAPSGLGTSIGLPTGFTQIATRQDTGTNVSTVAWAYKVDSGSETWPKSFTQASGATFNVWNCIILRGQDGTTPLDGTATHAGITTGTALSLAAITASLAGDTLVILINDANDVDVSSWPTGVTEYADASNPVGNGVMAGTKASMASGSTGTLSVTMGTSPGVTQGCAILVKAPAAGGTAWSQSITDAFSERDTSAHNPTKALLDAFSELDTLLKSLQKPFNDSWSTTDSSTRRPGKNLNDPLSEIDLFSRTWSAHLSLLDAISTLDTLAKMPKKAFLDWFVETDFVTETKFSGVSWLQNLSDAHSALDVVKKAPAKWVLDNFSQLDLFARTWTAHLTLQDWASETETLLKQVNKGVILDTTVSTDGILKNPGKSVLDRHSATDSQAKNTGKGLTDGTSALDSPAKSLLRTFMEQLSETDQVLVTRGVLLKLLDSVSLTDFVTSNYQKAVVQGVLGILSSFLSSSLGTSVAFGSTQLSETLSTQSGLLSQTPGHL